MALHGEALRLLIDAAGASEIHGDYVTATDLMVNANTLSAVKANESKKRPVESGKSK